MSRTQHNNRNRNIAARMVAGGFPLEDGDAGWLAFVVVAFAMSSMVGIKSPTRMRLAPVSPVAWTRSSTPGSSSPPARAS